MKKLLCIIALTLVMLTACEKEIQFEFYPEMREYYTESCGLQAVGADSVVLPGVFIHHNALKAVRVQRRVFPGMVGIHAVSVAGRFPVGMKA